MAAIFTLVSVLPSCSPIEADNGFDPDKKVPDPEGTVILSMRDKNSGNTYIDDCIRIENENFEGAEFIDLGAMQGLGNISYIPLGNWSSQVMVIPGHGYVAKSRYREKYYRIYVMSYITGVSGGIIGAEVKYQAPFYGSNEAIQPDKKQIIFGENGGSETVTFKNKYLIPYTVTCNEDWCKITADQNAITVTVEKTISAGEREGKIILSNMYGKTTEIQVRASEFVPKFELETEKPFENIAYENPRATVKVITNYGESIRFSSSSSRIDVKFENSGIDEFTYNLTVSISGPRPSGFSGIIYMESSFSGKREFLVIQKPQDVLEMWVGDGYMTVDRTSKAIELQLLASDKYTFSSSDPSWCTVMLTSGNGENMKTMTIRVSETTQNRKAVISCDQKDFKFELRQSKYVVGDQYSENGVTGIVYDFNCNYSHHGCIYKELGEYAWSNENVTVGCNGSGVSNFEKIKAIPNWETLYPAFKAVNDLNKDGITGWYMPADGEGPQLSYNYWLSSERNSSSAWYYHRYNSRSYDSKALALSVIAVHEF